MGLSGQYTSNLATFSTECECGAVCEVRPRGVIGVSVVDTKSTDRRVPLPISANPYNCRE